LVSLGIRLEGWEKELGLHIDFVSGSALVYSFPPSLRLGLLAGTGRRWLLSTLVFFLMSVTIPVHNLFGELGYLFGLERGVLGWIQRRYPLDFFLVRLMYNYTKRHDRYTAQRARWSTPANIERYLIFIANIMNFNLLHRDTFRRHAVV
jgi:hypothetical protein